MPKGFDDCQRAGGTIRTQKVSPLTFRRICTDKKGRVFKGHIETKVTKK